AFVVNRLLTRFLGEITSAVEQGTPVAVADRALDPLGLPMTPFELLTLVGPELEGIDSGDSPLTEEQVRANAVDALAQEIRLMLDEGVVQAVQDVDLCMLLGAGWPFWLGGISAYLDRSGVAERVTGSRFLPRGVASLPA